MTQFTEDEIKYLQSVIVDCNYLTIDKAREICERLQVMIETIYKVVEYGFGPYCWKSYNEWFETESHGSHRECRTVESHYQPPLQRVMQRPSSYG